MTVRAQQATGIDFSVIAAVVPDSCRISLTNGGAADFGVLNKSTIRTWQVDASAVPRYRGATAGLSRTLELQVDCLAPTRFALAVVDNRSASVYPGHDGLVFGLGFYGPPEGGEMSIGGYRIESAGLTVRANSDAAAMVPAKRLVTPGIAGEGSLWSPAVGDESIFLPPGKSVGFALGAGAISPDALMHVDAPLHIYFDLLQSTFDAASTPIRLNGAATLTFIGL